MRVKWSPSGCWNFTWHWVASSFRSAGGTRKQDGAEKKRKTHKEVQNWSEIHEIHPNVCANVGRTLLPVSMAAMMTTSLTQSYSQEASSVLDIWGSRGNSDMMMPISDRFPSLSRAAR